jgi:hypothetical protein
MDAGMSSDVTGDGGPVVEMDGGSDSGPVVELTPCQAACAAASEEGCEDNSTCEADLCSIRDFSANCEAEADAYLACIAATATEADFECNVEDKPAYTSTDCDDPYLYAWEDCFAVQ